jgi:uncharacterized repeat protein (TIGR04052 family)
MLFGLSRFLKHGAVLTAAAVIAACSSSDSNNTEEVPELRTVSIPFMLHAGHTHLNCGTAFADLGADERSGTVSKFRMYVSNIAVADENGDAIEFTLDENDYQAEGVALIEMVCDSDPNSINMAVTGSYRGDVEVAEVSFTVGVPVELNHGDYTAQSAPLNAEGMQWPWALGKRFLILEGDFDDELDNSSFVFHLGSTGCSGDPSLDESSEDYAAPGDVICSKPNRPEVSFTGFDSSAQAIKIDLKKLFGMTDFEESNVCHNGTQYSSELICFEVFTGLGLDDNGQGDASMQTVFTTSMSHGSMEM